MTSSVCHLGHEHSDRTPDDPHNHSGTRVGDVTIFGVGRYSMRMWLDPEFMRQRSLTPADVAAAVIFAVPLGLLGTVLVLATSGLANNTYVQIGLVLLIALSAKNAILVVEMASDRRAAGSTIVEAAVEAASVRFRPILMTSFTFMLGGLPLVLATGAGAHARKSLGITVFSGMFASTCLAVLLVPALYVVPQRGRSADRTDKADPSSVSLSCEESQPTPSVHACSSLGIEQQALVKPCEEPAGISQRFERATLHQAPPVEHQ